MKQAIGKRCADAVAGNPATASARRTGRRTRAAAIVVFVAIVVALLPAVPGNADNALPDPGWQVQATSPTTNLSDGQRLLINVLSRPDVSVNGLQIRECRWGATYASPADILPDNGNCPPRAVSSSADYFVVRGASDGVTSLAKTATGASVPFLVGSGVVEWSSSKPHSLTCDPAHTCALVIELSLGTASGPSTVFRTLKLSFTDDNPLAACGGFATGVLATGGSDEISDAWAQWTRAQCARTGKGAPSSVSFPGEGPSVASFVNGNLDLVYTSAGYDDTVGLAPANAGTTRPAIAVPIAVSASVIAAGGGQHQLVNGAPVGDKVRYPDGSIELTAAEVGALLGGGQPWISRLDKPYQSDILSRNPALQGILYAPDNGVYAPSESLASSWYMTKYLSTLAPTDFVRPTVVPAAPHGAVSSLALSDPPFDQINLYTGRPSLAKVTVPAESTATDGPIWTMTDLASARALDLTPVAIQSGAGFVAPNPASMYAAVAAMHTDSFGLLTPAATVASRPAVSAADTVEPYPLTYVLYALAPARPLVDSSNCVRTASQALLESWLHYLVGAGQQNLPAGMEPLPPALADEAALAVSLVGAAPTTGKCQTKTPAGDGDGSGDGSGSGNGGGPHHHGGGGGGGSTITPPRFGNGSRDFGSANGGIPTGVPVVASPGSTLTGRPLRHATEAAVHIPPFAGRDLAGSLSGILALVGIALTMAGAAWITARLFQGVAGASWTRRPLGARRIVSVVLLWVGAGLVGLALVLLALGPMLQQRDQRALLTRYKVLVSNAANETQGFPGQTEAATPPGFGSPVGIVEIGRLKSQDVVVEGVGAAQTREGPGHVPGTAGMGQPGNSVVVARRSGYGGVFAHIGRLHRGNHIVVTTTQGQSVYAVERVREVDISAIDSVYGATSDDRLTLVTAASRAPWDTDRATEVVARLTSKPFPPTPQQSRNTSDTGTHGDGGLVPAVILALLAFAGVIAASVALYDKLRFRTAYMLTIAPFVAITVITGETLVRLLPAWT